MRGRATPFHPGIYGVPPPPVLQTTIECFYQFALEIDDFGFE